MGGYQQPPGKKANTIADKLNKKRASTPFKGDDENPDRVMKKLKGQGTQVLLR